MDKNHSRREFLRMLAVAAASFSELPRSASAQQGVQHTLWVVDHLRSYHLTGNQTQTLLGSISVLNLAFMAPLISNAIADRITAQFSVAPNFTPGDAVVFIVSRPDKSVLGNVSPPKPSALGRTGLQPGTPSICEVYWERCVNDLEVAGAIFHEAAHGMSRKGDEMHDYKSLGAGGGKVRVLAEYQPGYPQFPSHADLEFYLAAIQKRTPFVTTVP